MRQTWTPGALQHDGGGRTLQRSGWSAEVREYPLEEPSACWWPDQWRALVVELVDVDPPLREDDPAPVAGWIENGNGYAIDFVLGEP